jgi:hypothetical protein
MTTEKQILERLDRIEAQLAPVSASAKGLNELKEDLIPLSGQAFRLMIRELEDVESGFQLEDLLALMKRSLRSVKHLQFALEQLENIVDFAQTIEPLLKSSVPQLINYLDDLEQKGVMRIIQSTLDVRAKVAASYFGKNGRIAFQGGSGECQTGGTLWYDRGPVQQGGQTGTGCVDGTDQGHGWAEKRRRKLCSGRIRTDRLVQFWENRTLYF